MNKNPDVDVWFAEKSHPLEDAMQLVRATALECHPGVEESIKWKTPTVSYKGNIFSFNPAKNLVSLLFHRGAEIPGDHPRLEGEGKLARTMRFADIDDVRANSDALTKPVKSWCLWKDES